MTVKKSSFLIIHFLCVLLFFISEAYAAENRTTAGFEPLDLVFSSETTVYAGFTTDGKVASVVAPVNALGNNSELKFKYDPDDGSFYIDNLFYYAQVFVNAPVKINLYSSGQLFNGKNYIRWTSSAADTLGFSCDSTSLNPFLVVDEKTEPADYLNYPRPYSGEIMIRIPVENVTDTSLPYSTSLTLEVIQI